MQYITADHGRWQLIKYLLNSDNGDHFDKDKEQQKEGFSFQHVKIRCFRLEPSGEEGNRGVYGIDGENYQAQKMQACLDQKKILTFA